MERNKRGAGNRITDLPSRDESAALEAAGGNEDLARELVESLVRSLPQEIAELQRWHTADTWSQLADAAHRMRGATSYCGVPAIDELLEELERAARTSNAERIELNLAQVIQEADRLTRFVSTAIFARQI